MSTPSTYPEILERLRSTGLFPNDRDADGALRATLAALAGLLTSDERRVLARALPPELQPPDTAFERAPSASRATFFGLVAAHEGVRAGVATEQAEVVCRVLGAGFSGETHAHLAHALPELAPLFEPAEPTATDSVLPAVSSRTPGSPHDLAEGREGGSHPVSSADPRRLAHRHSVARSDEPHADTKLSSARGITQEREEHSLATGEPGSQRPLSREH